jgi:hypothetical protein
MAEKVVPQAEDANQIAAGWLAASLDRDFSPMRIRAMLAAKADDAADAVSQQYAEMPAVQWPRFRSDAVLLIRAQLDVLRETLPAITSSDIYPKETQASVQMAAHMLADYSIACETVERHHQALVRNDSIANAFNRGVMEERRKWEDSDIYREGTKVIADREARKARRERAKAKR